MNSGPGGTSNKSFESFSVDEMQKFMVVQIAHGLSPRTRVEMKFK